MSVIRKLSPVTRDADPDRESEHRPRISIGLPVYNGERYVHESINSILNQTFRDLELIISDNGSTDGTSSICESFAAEDSRIRYFRSEANHGAAWNFNRVFELSRGKYFKWAAHDDVCKSAYLQACWEVLEGDATIVLCHSEIDVIDDLGSVTKRHDDYLGLVGDPNPAERFRNLVLTNHGCFDVFGVIRRSALSQTRLIAGFIGSDRTLLAELSLRGRFHRIPSALFLSRDHAQRSIKSMELRDRSAWFDPSLAGKTTLPYWRYLIEYIRCIHRVPIGTRHRLACYKTLAQWIRWYWKFFEMDIRLAIQRQLTKRSSRRPATF